MQKNIKIQTINPYLMCALCSGYLIDATTLVECLHSFCRSCLLKYLESSYNCPKCGLEIHKTKPLDYIRSDPCLQEIVYKLVPDLFSKEENRRRSWKKGDKNPDEPGPSAMRDEAQDDSRILVTLKYFRGTSRMERIKTENVLQMFPTRYLCCNPDMPVRVLKKFVCLKFDISPEIFHVELWRGDETLLDELTLKHLVQIYGLYRERKPLDLHFSLYPKFDTKTTKDTTPEVKKPIPKFDPDAQMKCCDVNGSITTDEHPSMLKEEDIKEEIQNGFHSERTSPIKNEDESSPPNAETSMVEDKNDTLNDAMEYTIERTIEQSNTPEKLDEKASVSALDDNSLLKNEIKKISDTSTKSILNTTDSDSSQKSNVSSLDVNLLTEDDFKPETLENDFLKLFDSDSQHNSDVEVSCFDGNLSMDSDIEKISKTLGNDILNLFDTGQYHLDERITSSPNNRKTTSFNCNLSMVSNDIKNSSVLMETDASNSNEVKLTEECKNPTADSSKSKGPSEADSSKSKGPSEADSSKSKGPSEADSTKGGDSKEPSKDDSKDGDSKESSKDGLLKTGDFKGPSKDESTKSGDSEEPSKRESSKSGDIKRPCEGDSTESGDSKEPSKDDSKDGDSKEPSKNDSSKDGDSKVPFKGDSTRGGGSKEPSEDDSCKDGDSKGPFKDDSKDGLSKEPSKNDSPNGGDGKATSKNDSSKGSNKVNPLITKTKLGKIPKPKPIATLSEKDIMDAIPESPVNEVDMPPELPEVTTVSRLSEPNRVSSGVKVSSRNDAKRICEISSKTSDITKKKNTKVGDTRSAEKFDMSKLRAELTIGNKNDNKASASKKKKSEKNSVGRAQTSNISRTETSLVSVDNSEKLQNDVTTLLETDTPNESDVNSSMENDIMDITASLEKDILNFMGDSDSSSSNLNSSVEHLPSSNVKVLLEPNDQKSREADSKCVVETVNLNTQIDDDVSTSNVDLQKGNVKEQNSGLSIGDNLIIDESHEENSSGVISWDVSLAMADVKSECVNTILSESDNARLADMFIDSEENNVLIEDVAATVSIKDDADDSLLGESIVTFEDDAISTDIATSATMDNVGPIQQCSLVNNNLVPDPVGLVNVCDVGREDMASIESCIVPAENISNTIVPTVEEYGDEPMDET